MSLETTSPHGPAEVWQLVADWSTSGSDSVICRVIKMEGFGGRRSGEVLAVSADAALGNLALGAANTAAQATALQLLSGSDQLRAARIPVDESEAVSAGLACGGVAHVIAQRVSTLPPEWAQNMKRGTDQVLLTDVAVGATRLVTLETQIAETDTLGHAAQRMLTKGPASANVVQDEDGAEWFVEPFVATPNLLVLGVAQLSKAIVSQGALLGWNVEVIDDKTGVHEGIGRASSYGPADGVVVLSHDIGASCAVLAAALRHRCGYVGALGSRHTQMERSAELRDAHGCSEEDLRRICGPVGLDLGSRSPEETALAIVAEMLSVTRRRNAQSLRQHGGAING